MTNRNFWIAVIVGAAVWSATAWLSSLMPSRTAYGTTTVIIAWGLVMVSGAMLGALVYLAGSNAIEARKKKAQSNPTGASDPKAR
jgi:hypothetical protein